MQQSNHFYKGMKTDLPPRIQPKDSYRFALNAVIETKEDMMVLSSEQGNTQFNSSNYPVTKTLIGSVHTEDNSSILFFYDSGGNHEIGQINLASGVYSTLIINSCLNFQQHYPVNAVFTTNNGGDRWVYFTDQYNDYRTINLSNLSAYSNNTCDILRFSKHYTIPTVRVDQIKRDAGGILGCGVYNVSLRYVDANGTATQWLLNSKPIAIGLSSELNLNNTYSYTQYIGSSNNEDSDYYDEANKSISLRFENIDYTRYTHVQLAFTHRGQDSGAFTSVKVTNKIPITDYLLNYTYTGNISQIERDSSIEELLSEVQRFEIVQAQAIEDNRLFVGGIYNQDEDYSSFQRYASPIKIQWVKTRDALFNNSAKDADYYFDQGSFLDDEVVSLGIVFIHQDGRETPVFHIPGRPADVSVTGSNIHIGTAGVATDGLAWDRGAVVNYGDYLPSNWTQRWQAISTATYEGQNPSIGYGLMGFYESSENYPNVKACDGHIDGYWGRDWTGRLITTTDKIRHHRMPSRSTRPLTSPDRIERLGIRVSGVTYPPGIVGHRIVMGDRSTEKTILDKGILIPITASSGTDLEINPSSITPTPYAYSVGNSLSLRMYAFLSAKQQYLGTSLSPDYITVEALLEDENFTNSTGPNFSTTSTTINGDTINWETELFSFTWPNAPSSFMNYAILSSTSADPAVLGQLTTPSHTISSSSTTVVNNSLSLKFQVFNLSSILSEIVSNGTTPDDRVYYVSLRSNKSVFSNLAAITYKQVHTSPLYSTTTVDLFGGDSFIGPVNITDYSFTFPSLTSGTIKAYHISYLSNEDRINPAFRSYGKSPENNFFKWNYNYSHNQLRAYMRSKIHQIDSTSRTAYIEKYGYNNSYSFNESLAAYYPHLDDNLTQYIYCGNKSKYFPSRLYYSNAQSEESYVNEHLTVLTNNYQDLPLESGAITDLFSNYNNLYASTERVTYKIPLRQQSLTTQDSVVFLGKADVFSITPQALNSSTIAFSGNKSWTSRVQSEYGTLYVDSLGGRVILLTDQINDLAKEGMREFFKNNSDHYFDTLFKRNNSVYPYINYAGKYGIGFRSYYDARFNRFIISKKEFRITKEYEATFRFNQIPVLANTLYYYNKQFYFVDSNGVANVADFNNTDLFENKSWTISYSIPANSWISFHSYIPTWAFNADNKVFSSFLDGRLYLHNSGNYLSFYNMKYNFIVDSVIPHQETIMTTHTLKFKADISAKDSEGEFIKSDGFNSIIVYNSTQSSGKLDLIHRRPLDLYPSVGGLFYSKIDGEYRINDTRDIVKVPDKAIWDASWNSLSSFPFNYIDKVPNASNIDLTASQYYRPRFRDEYIGVRLFANNLTQDKKISISNIKIEVTQKLQR